MTADRRRMVASGEAMAMMHGGRYGLHADRNAMWFSFGPPVKANEVSNGIATVYIRGGLEHHDEGCGDSYDAIVTRIGEALESDARTVVLRIDSPGGAVSGLNQCVAEIVAMRESARKPIVAYVDETAASAAFALTCGCTETIAPPSALLGSVGVISTMTSYAKADEAYGVQVAVITSGARKADGHPALPITDDAIAAEQARVDRMAMQFFKLASNARGVPVADIQGLQAGLFLARDAVRVGLADAVMGWRDLSEMLRSGG